MMEENKPMPAKAEPRRIVRLLSTDVDGRLPVVRALRKIKGISFMFSNAVCLSTGVDPKKKLGLLTEAEIMGINEYFKSLGQGKNNLPLWMINRRNDIETGENFHLIGSSLDFRKREDINTMKRMRAYRGVRHEFGLPVRGQRTRSSFRKNKTVGVSRKKAMAARKASPKEEKK
jgi:small subunit ribosomal protein S13